MCPKDMECITHSNKMRSLKGQYGQRKEDGRGEPHTKKKHCSWSFTEIRYQKICMVMLTHRFGYLEHQVQRKIWRNELWILKLIIKQSCRVKQLCRKYNKQNYFKRLMQEIIGRTFIFPPYIYSYCPLNNRDWEFTETFRPKAYNKGGLGFELELKKNIWFCEQW